MKTIVEISATALDMPELAAVLPRSSQSTGAVVSFTGYVRGQGISAMALEHYPGMTEASITQTIESAAKRWPIEAAHVVHRVGELFPGEPIVWVAVASAHRAASFSACEYIMDYLKISAPLWKREADLSGNWRWVDAKESDTDRADRWGRSPRVEVAS